MKLSPFDAKTHSFTILDSKQFSLERMQKIFDGIKNQAWKAKVEGTDNLGNHRVILQHSTRVVKPINVAKPIFALQKEPPIEITECGMDLTRVNPETIYPDRSEFLNRLHNSIKKTIEMLKKIANETTKD